MNYDKKRKRQAGRQKQKPGQDVRMKKVFDKMGKAVEIMIARGILPPVNFHKPGDDSFVPTPPYPLTPICNRCELKIVSEFFDVSTIEHATFQEKCPKCMTTEEMWKDPQSAKGTLIYD